MSDTIIRMTEEWIADLEGHLQRDRALATVAFMVDDLYRRGVQPPNANRGTIQALTGSSSSELKTVVSVCGGFNIVFDRIDRLEIHDTVGCIESVYRRLEDALGLPSE